MAAWYLAHADELLIDLDDAMRPTRTREPWIEVFFRRRLREAIVAGKLAVRSVYLAPSASAKHYHAIVQLDAPMPLMERLVWQLHLGSDLYRGRADLMRAARSIVAPSLLIRSHDMIDFYRPPDRRCACVTKHVTSEAPTCAVWRELRGLSPWELFGRSDPAAVEKGVLLNVGRVSLAKILHRELVNESEGNGKETA